MRASSFFMRHINWVEIAFGVAAVCFMASCTELSRPEPNPYLAETQPPPKQEFRWSNGPLPKSLDPARASAAPETDVVRAIYEGLTEIDAKTLDAVPGVAEKWSVSEDGKTWTFTLRKNAKWSNGRSVTADDFVRSWQRLYDLGENAAHRQLLSNLAVGPGNVPTPTAAEPEDFVETPELEAPPPQVESPDASTERAETDPLKSVRLAVSAADGHTLIVKLNKADEEFPKLVAHPIFRPVFGSGAQFDEEKLDAKIVTNGAFQITEISPASVLLERSETYWNKENVKLDRVEFVPVEKADEALEAYRTGKVDAVTNTEFAPLAQKVFSPYADFRKSAFAALNFLEINHTKPPFNDRRVREALAISIERERLSPGELEGTTLPALSFLPFAKSGQAKLTQDKERARELLEQAGFEDGRGFPVVRLIVNRNDTQQRVARAVVKMWKENLGIDTELVVKETSEISQVRESRDFDVLRRGVVLPIPNESVCMSAILGFDQRDELPENINAPTALPSPVRSVDPFVSQSPNTNQNTANEQPADQSLTEAVALYELHAIPLYFPTSFALVKPYVTGFEMNSLDAPLLSEVSIDSSWQPR